MLHLASTRAIVDRSGRLQKRLRCIWQQYGAESVQYFQDKLRTRSVRRRSEISSNMALARRMRSAGMQLTVVLFEA